MLLAKYVQGEPLDLRRIDRSQGAYMAELRNTGFLDFVPSPQPDVKPGETAVETLEIVDGKICQKWHIEANETNNPG